MARELCASSRSSSKPSVCWLLRQYMAPSLNFSNCRTYMKQKKIPYTLNRWTKWDSAKHGLGTSHYSRRGWYQREMFFSDSLKSLKHFTQPQISIKINKDTKGDQSVVAHVLYNFCDIVW
jgi:hypothetical protein